MTDVRKLIENARKNPPPLKKIDLNTDRNEFVFLEDNSTSIIDKLFKHRKFDREEDDKTNNEMFKWLKMKEKMVASMESKRNEEWIQQNLSLLEDEELNENVDDESKESDCEEMKDDVDVENRLVGNDDQSEVEDVDEEENEHSDSEVLDDGDDEESVDDNDNISENRCKNSLPDCNTNVIDEDVDEGNNDNENINNDNVNEVIDDPFEFNDDDDVGSIKTKKIKKIVIDDDDDDSNVCQEENFKNERISELFDERDYFPTREVENFVSQNLALTPMFTQNESDFSKNTMENTDFVPFDSQTLADLCSGKFIESEAIDPVNNESVDSYDETVEISSEKRSKMTRQFFDDEAELSGSDNDVSSDENEDDDDELEYDEIQEDLPSDDELHDQVEKIYNKNMLDEDKRQLMILKEHFFDDGDLHDDGKNRKRKFKWNFDGEEMDNFANVLSDSDESDGEFNTSDGDDNDDGKPQSKEIRLKMNSEDIAPPLTTSIEAVDSGSMATKKIKPKLFDVRAMNKKKNMSISSFLIRDERLKDIMNKRVARNIEITNKRFKSQNSVSIFDVLES